MGHDWLGGSGGVLWSGNSMKGGKDFTKLLKLKRVGEYNSPIAENPEAVSMIRPH